MNDYTQRRLEEQIEEWKKEVGEIPENTCPSIDGIINDIEKYVDEVEYLRKNAHKYESAEDLGKDLPDSGWSGLASDIDVKLRKDNEKLRELGIFWYEKCKELSTSIHQAIAEERDRVKVEIEEIPDTLNVDSQQIYENRARQIYFSRESCNTMEKTIKKIIKLCEDTTDENGVLSEIATKAKNHLFL